MKVLQLFMCLFAIGALALTSCQSESAAKVTENAEAAVSGAKTNVEAAAQKAAANKDAAPVPAGPTTTIKFDDTTYDFGAITDGDKVRHTFKFTNTGNEPLIISNCKGSCGCTVPQCPKNPIAPGGNGEITVEYNSRNKSKGEVAGKPDQKFINVIANTEPSSTRLTIKALVKADPNAPKPAPKKAAPKKQESM